MSRWVVCLLSTVLVSAMRCEEEPRVAIVHMVGAVTGSVEFAETTAGAEGVTVRGTLRGMPPGEYGLHVHELGDVDSCDTTGAHFELGGRTHGGRDHEVRHIGDLGNVQFDADGNATIDFVDAELALRGERNVLGRALVLHERRDDLGLGGAADSLTTGAAGARVACGVIGIKSPAGAWNSAAAFAPSSFIIIMSLFVFILFTNK